MKKYLTILFVLIFLQGYVTVAQYQSGKVNYEHLYSKLLENPGAENPTRRVTIYLPPGYEKSGQQYQVIYYLHGFTWSDSLMIGTDHFDKLLDKAIATHKIRPVVVVMPDEYTLYRGSFYTNSSLTGKWGDFTGIDLVKFIDKKYRTIPNRESRGVAAMVRNINSPAFDGHFDGEHGMLWSGNTKGYGGGDLWITQKDNGG